VQKALPLLRRRCIRVHHRAPQAGTRRRRRTTRPSGYRGAGDVSDPEDLDALYRAVADSGRRLDVVFANAATIDVARIGEITDGLSVYAGIKAALRSFARTWASELRDRKIRVNVVSPGATDTPGIHSLAGVFMPGPTAAADFENAQRVVPLGRYATADEVAAAVLFLASDLRSITTGAEIPVDGGINQL
jgi:NAD(P)-dependent dehydrogenase (short-subunit alcohol dehydrogenase family)